MFCTIRTVLGAALMHIALRDCLKLFYFTHIQTADVAAEQEFASSSLRKLAAIRCASNSAVC
jgi:hypothetical protein